MSKTTTSNPDRADRFVSRNGEFHIRLSPQQQARRDEPIVVAQDPEH